MPGSAVSLSSVTLKAVGFNPRSVLDPTKPDYSPLVSLIAMIFYFPLSWRKFILDVCRIQAPVFQNNPLIASYYNLAPRQIYSSNEHYGVAIQFDIEDVANLLDCISPYPILCSLLSYFVRAESTAYVNEFRNERLVSLDKELKAALEYSVDEQILDYSCLDSSTRNHLHPQMALTGSCAPSKLVRRWQSGIEGIKAYLSNARTPPIFPAYNAGKNVSYATTDELMARVYGPDYHVTSVDRARTTTLSLLQYFYKTGDRVPGPIEMRQAWFFNDLKPRTYYCLGGTDFWAGLYIQEIANAFARILPSTNPDTRFDVSRIHNVSSDREVLITYDYSSFTTSLNELKFFMFWLAEQMRGTPCTVLCVREGLKTYDLGEMLHSYNELVNQHQVFSTERFFPLTERTLFRQGRNGSLGVKGNIVFSTTLHGISLSSLTGTPDEDSCVGDDALANILASMISLFIACVNNLGVINDTKFTMLKHHPDEPEHQIFEQFKYLKRPLNLNFHGGVELGILDFFPDVAGILFPSGDGIHSAKAIDRDHVTGVKTFIMQWARFLRIQLLADDNSMVSDDDREVLLALVAACYKKVGLPIEGAPPGLHWVPLPGKEGNARVDLMIPPCTWDVFFVPWEDALLDQHRGKVFPSPIWMGGELPPPVSIETGDRFRCTPSKLLVLCEDLGIITSSTLVEDVIFDEEYLQRYRARLFSEGGREFHLLKDYVVVGSVPFWYLDVALYYHPETIPSDKMEVMSRVSSLMSF